MRLLTAAITALLFLSLACTPPPASPLAEPAQPPPAKPAPAKLPEPTGKTGKVDPPAPEKVTWLNPKDKVTLGDYRIKIDGLDIARVGLSGVRGHTKSADRYLIVDVAVENLSLVRKRDFHGWHNELGTKVFPDLWDEHGNTYRRRTWDSAFATFIRDEGDVGPIPPDRRIVNRLVFEPPVERAKILYLSLPLENIGHPGEKIRFKILAETVWRDGSPAK